MVWHTLTNTDFLTLSETNWGGLDDGTPTSYAGAFVWQGATNFKWYLTSESQWQGAVEAPILVPFHVDWTGIKNIEDGSIDNGWNVTNITVHVL